MHLLDNSRWLSPDWIQGLRLKWGWASSFATTYILLGSHLPFLVSFLSLWDFDDVGYWQREPRRCIPFAMFKLVKLHLLHDNGLQCLPPLHHSLKWIAIQILVLSCCQKEEKRRWESAHFLLSRIFRHGKIWLFAEKLQFSAEAVIGGIERIAWSLISLISLLSLIAIWRLVKKSSRAQAYSCVALFTLFSACEISRSILTTRWNY